MTIEAAGEIWFEEESPIFISKQGATTSTKSSSDTISSQLSEVSLSDAKNEPLEQRIPRNAKPAGVKIVEVEAEENLDTFSRLGQGLSLASGFVKSTAEMAKAELGEFKVKKNSIHESNLGWAAGWVGLRRGEWGPLPSIFFISFLKPPSPSS